MENEGNALRTLNNLKNRKIMRCDYAFNTLMNKEDPNDDE